MPHIKLYNSFGEPFPFFNSIKKQPHRQRRCCGLCLLPATLSPNDKLPNFQVIKKGSGITIVNAEVYEFDAKLGDVYVNDFVFPHFTHVDGVGINATIKFTYKGQFLPIISTLDCDKYYYIKVNFDDGTSYFSDLFQTFERCCLHLLEWSDDCDIGKINFTDTNYVKQLYLRNCELTQSIRQVNIGGIEQADGSFIYREQIVNSWVRYDIEFANTYLVAAINAFAVHSYKRFYDSNGISFDILNTEISTNETAGRNGCNYTIILNMLQGSIVTKGLCCGDDIDKGLTYNIEPNFVACGDDLPCPTLINPQISSIDTTNGVITFIIPSDVSGVEYSFDAVTWIPTTSETLTLTGLMPCTEYTIYFLHRLKLIQALQ